VGICCGFAVKVFLQGADAFDGGATKVVTGCGGVDQQQQRGHGAVQVADRQRGARQRAGVAVFKAVGLNGQAGVGIAIPSDIAGDVGVAAVVPAVGVAAAVQGCVQRHLKQFDDGARCQCSQLLVDAANRRPDNRVIGNGATNVGWPRGLGAGAGTSRGALEDETGSLYGGRPYDGANGICS